MKEIDEGEEVRVTTNAWNWTAILGAVLVLGLFAIWIWIREIPKQPLPEKTTVFNPSTAPLSTGGNTAPKTTVVTPPGTSPETEVTQTPNATVVTPPAAKPVEEHTTIINNYYYGKPAPVKRKVRTVVRTRTVYKTRRYRRQSPPRIIVHQPRPRVVFVQE